MDIRAIVGRNLKVYRKRAGFSQEGLAIQLSCWIHAVNPSNDLCNKVLTAPKREIANFPVTRYDDQVGAPPQLYPKPLITRGFSDFP